MFETPVIAKPTLPLRRGAAVRAAWKPLLLNLLLPGAGYWVIGQKLRARILFCVWCLFLAMGFLQMQFGMVNGVRGGVYTPKLDPFEWLPTLGAMATAGIGPAYALFAAFFGGAGSEPIRNLTQEYGATYVMIAGLLNWLCCFDIFDRTTGRWMWRLPKDEFAKIRDAAAENRDGDR
ncbi:MAG: hypothetical protein LBQ86_00760 [Holophagales bacterium]|jgi:hypothetical protein|nr:hypothetical protein [Holophagales bacterium]